MLQAFALTRLGESDLLRLSAVHEKFSEHPFGQALVKAAQDKGLSVRDAQQFAAPARGGAARDHRGEQDASAGRAGYVDLGRCRLAPLQRTSRSVLIGLVLPRAGARRSPFRRSERSGRCACGTSGGVLRLPVSGRLGRCAAYPQPGARPIEVGPEAI